MKNIKENISNDALLFFNTTRQPTPTPNLLFFYPLFLLILWGPEEVTKHNNEARSSKKMAKNKIYIYIYILFDYDVAIAITHMLSLTPGQHICYCYCNIIIKEYIHLSAYGTTHGYHRSKASSLSPNPSSQSNPLSLKLNSLAMIATSGIPGLFKQTLNLC